MPRSGTWHVQHLPTSTGRLFIRRRDGAGVPLLLWPSVFYDHSLYLGLCEWLDNPVILLDSPGHGRSEGCPNPLTLELCAKAQDEILAALGIREAVLVGTSWGGLVDVVHGLNDPSGRIRGLILANTPFATESRPKLSTRAVVAMSRFIPTLQVFREGIAKAFFSPQTRLRHPEVLQNFLEQSDTFAHPELYPVIRSVLLDRPSLLPRLGGLKQPVLVIAGEDDTNCPVAGMKAAAAAIPDHTLEVIPGSGHVSLAERPHESALRIRKWLAEHFEAPVVATDT